MVKDLHYWLMQAMRDAGLVQKPKTEEIRGGE